MKNKLIIATLFWILTNNAFAQGGAKWPLSGWWINTQYEYFKNQLGSERIVYNISPWYIYIDSSDKCSIELMYEQKTDMGDPINKKVFYDVREYHYKKNYDVWLYNVRGNDSLLIYSNGVTPGAGIIFKKCIR